MFGNYAEVSQDVHDTVDAFARRLAHAHWQSLACRSAAEAYSFLVARARRRLGTLVARAHARHRLRRLPLVGLTRAALPRRVAAGALAGAPVGSGFGGDGDLLRDAMQYLAHPAHAAGR